MVELNGQLRRHPQFKITAVRVGIEELPVLVIDNFLSNPDILLEYAAAHASFDRSDNSILAAVRRFRRSTASRYGPF